MDGLKILRGMRDFAPSEMIKRNFIFDTVRSVFEIYGFNSLETPAVENWNILSKKGAGGSEILKETYKFEDKSGRNVGLRYDLTVPLARYIAMNPKIPMPFKRYQISRVWRYSEVSKGRLREFWQADCDIVGCVGMIADGEVIACAVSALKRLGFEDFTVRINNRKILTALVNYSGADKKFVLDILKTIDKLDKIGYKGVEKELQNLDASLEKNSIKKILEFINISADDNKIVLKKADELIGSFEEGKKGINELLELITYLELMGVSDNFLKIDLSLARGLDYYTGPIFEIVAGEGVGSIAGGGRYDNMIGIFSEGKNRIYATGISLGIERIIEVMKDRKMLPEKKTKIKVFVINVNSDVRSDTIRICQKLREEKINAAFDLKSRKLKKQLDIANNLGIPYTLIVGQKELKDGSVILKNMESGEQKIVKINEVFSFPPFFLLN